MAEAVTVTFRQLLEMERALAQLDAIRESEKEFVPIQFDTKTSYRLMRNAEAVAKERARFDKLDREAAKSAGFVEGMAANDENAKKCDDYQHRRGALLDNEIKVELVRLKIEELLNRPEEYKKSKRNPVPQSVLNRLAPMIEEGEL